MEGKEETIEEVAENFINKQDFKSLKIDDKIFEAILLGAKWKAIRSFSNDEVKEIAKYAFNVGRRMGSKGLSVGFSFDEWFENFKKK